MGIDLANDDGDDRQPRLPRVQDVVKEEGYIVPRVRGSQVHRPDSEHGTIPADQVGPSTKKEAVNGSGSCQSGKCSCGEGKAVTDGGSAVANLDDAVPVNVD